MTASALLDGGPGSRAERAFPSLDGLRAVAATSVLVHHVAFWTGNYTPDVLGRVFGRLDVGVPIFFVLSGFLLSRPIFLAATGRRHAPRAAAYLWRRALRILPAYWITVVAALLLLRVDDAGTGTWLRHLTLTQIYGTAPMAAGLTHAWSLCTEAAFYLVLPLAGAGLARLARRSPRRPAAVLVALGVAGAAGFAWLAWTWSVPRPLGSASPDLWLPAYTGWFAAGMALAVLSVADPGWGPVRVAADLGSSLPTCWAAAGTLFWISTSTIAGPIGLYQPTPTQAVVKNALYLGVAALLVLPLVAGDQTGWTRRALASGPGRFLGEISYGIFLVHVVLLTGVYEWFGLVQFTGSMGLMTVGLWLVSAALATLLYVLVERPLRRWRSVVRDTPASGRTATRTAATAIDART